MSAGDLLALLPLLIVAYGAVLVLMLGAVWRERPALLGASLAVAAGGLLAIPYVWPLAPRQVTSLLRVDTLALSYGGLFLLGGAAIAAISHDYLRESGPGRERYYALLLLAILGALVLAASNHFVSFFLGLEVLSVSLYGLIGFSRRQPTSLEASLKYVVLAGVAASFLLLGIALLYSEYGHMEFQALRASSGGMGHDLSALASLGLALIVVGFGFKVAAVPFHSWAPDVYQGAPAPVSALVATASKAAMFVLLIRLMAEAGLWDRPSVLLLLEVLAILTMLGGNLLALLQRNIKRLIAYSSVAHIGYLLIPVVAGGPESVASIAFYFVSYFVATIGAFAVISVLSTRGVELEDLEDYRGLGLHSPWLGGTLALAVLSLAGVPLTIGFMAKFYILAAAARAGLWLLLVVGVLTSGVAAYYYLRVLVALYLRPAERDVRVPAPRPCTTAVLAAVIVLVILFGLYPSPLISLAQQTSAVWLASP